MKDFATLDDMVGGNIAEKFNVYYVQSINNIINLMKKHPFPSPKRRVL